MSTTGHATEAAHYACGVFEQQTLIADEGHAMSLEASLRDDSQEYGAVFTRRWVVDLILDLAGYVPERNLVESRVIEPACGDGAFLQAIVDRLIESHGRHGGRLEAALGAVRACDLQPDHVAVSRELVTQRLSSAGLDAKAASELAASWVRHDDFLLSRHESGTADFVVGNPPYIRLEAVPQEISDAYRRACPTMGGRADVFVGFFEVALKALKPGGALGFICADRWMRNQYGQRLRSLVARHYSVDATIEMHDVDAFEADVSAYPSITILRRAPQGPALMATARSSFGVDASTRIRKWAANSHDRTVDDPDFDASHLPGWFDGTGSWPAGSPERLALIAELERTHPALEDDITRTRVGIGVATGADQVFVTTGPGIVEEERELPLAMARDTATGRLAWSGHHLIDPWDGDTGSLVRLDEYPRLREYFEAHSSALNRRNVAGRRPDQWYRTIDRVDHTLTARPKLLFPDIKATIHPVLDEGNLYPHHNLYWVASHSWDPSVLGGLLLSRVAQLFIECYAVRMRGGYLRFQAQYLRRIRVPRLDDLSSKLAADFTRAFETRDVDLATSTALSAYGIAALPR